MTVKHDARSRRGAGHDPNNLEVCDKAITSSRVGATQEINVARPASLETRARRPRNQRRASRVHIIRLVKRRRPTIIEHALGANLASKTTATQSADQSRGQQLKWHSIMTGFATNVSSMPTPQRPRHGSTETTCRGMRQGCERDTGTPHRTFGEIRHAPTRPKMDSVLAKAQSQAASCCKRRRYPSARSVSKPPKCQALRRRLYAIWKNWDTQMQSKPSACRNDLSPKHTWAREGIWAGQTRAVLTNMTKRIRGESAKGPGCE